MVAQAIAFEIMRQEMEGHYVAFVNAAKGSASESDYWRWNGQAEAYRTMLERSADLAGLPPVNYQSREWRAANGVRHG